MSAALLPASVGAAVALQSGGGLLQLIFVAGSLLFLLGIWLVLRSPLDLTQEGEGSTQGDVTDAVRRDAARSEADRDPPGEEL